MGNLFMDRNEFKEKRAQAVDSAKEFASFDKEASELFGYHQASSGGIRHSYWNAAIESVIKLVADDRAIAFGGRDALIRSIATLKVK